MRYKTFHALTSARASVSTALEPYWLFVQSPLFTPVLFKPPVNKCSQRLCVYIYEGVTKRGHFFHIQLKIKNNLILYSKCENKYLTQHTRELSRNHSNHQYCVSLTRNCSAIVERVKNTRAPFYRPELPQQESEGVHPGILTLMRQCWAEEPSDRPSFIEVAKAIRTINKGK